MNNRIKAIAFDFNGVIVDDERLHFESMRDVCREFGIEMTESDYWNKYLSLDDENALKAIISENKNKLSTKDFSLLLEKKISSYVKMLYERGESVFFPNAVETVKQFAKKFQLAVVSGARREEIEYALKLGGISKLFKVIVAAGETNRGKPFPDQYLKAVELLSLRPDEVAAIEDSIGGIKAAKAAGLCVAAVAHSYPVEKLTEADFVFSNLFYVNINELL